MRLSILAGSNTLGATYLRTVVSEHLRLLAARSPLGFDTTATLRGRERRRR